MAFPEPVRTRAADIFIVPRLPRNADIEPHRGGIVVSLRRWGGDDELYDHNSDGIPDFPLRANMRYDRERRRRTVNQVVVIDQPDRSLDQAEGPSLHHVPGRRVWAGIGGFLFIPSFPQLRRKETIWPDAT